MLVSVTLCLRIRLYTRLVVVVVDISYTTVDKQFVDDVTVTL